MMGTRQRDFRPLPESISLEELVPKDNFYRRLDERIDLSFVRELVRPLYAKGGRPSVDPVVFFRLQLVMFFEDIRSERELMRVAADRLSVRWFLGYDLHEPLPDHSSLTRIRERYGLEVFRRFFELIVEMCFEAGLVWGKELFFDSTKVEANAAVDSLAPRWAVEAHLEELFEEEEMHPPQQQDEEISEKSCEIAQLPTAREDGLRVRNAAKNDWISRAGRQDRPFESGYRPRTSDSRASKTDLDATPMTWAKSGRRLGYQVHNVVDGGKARIILNALVTPSEVTENRPMLDLLWSTIFRWCIHPRQVTGDAKYGTRENVAGLERMGIRAYVAIPNFDFRDTGLFGPGHFRYDPEKDVHVCPAGELLRRRARNSGARGTMYRAKPETCNACELKKLCTDSKNGRTVYRPRDEDYYGLLRQGARLPRDPSLRESPTKEEGVGRALVRRGQRLARDEEVPLEEAREGEHRSSADRLGPENVKRLLEFGSRRPKKQAQAAALRPSDTLRYENGRAREHRSGRSWRPTRAFFNSLGRFWEEDGSA
jgi:transposase